MTWHISADSGFLYLQSDPGFFHFGGRREAGWVLSSSSGGNEGGGGGEIGSSGSEISLAPVP